MTLQHILQPDTDKIKSGPAVRAWQNQFLDCLGFLFIRLFRCADYLSAFCQDRSRGWNHTCCIGEERGLSDQGKRLSVPICVDVQCVRFLTHTLSKDLWKDV